jgi:hypothetical protein
LRRTEVVNGSFDRRSKHIPAENPLRPPRVCIIDPSK